MPDKLPNAARPRGRPPGSARADVHGALLSAFRECLAQRSHSEITLKQVADRAGTSQEMVRYYFGGKDGLVTALLRQTTEYTAHTLDELESRIADAGDQATRRLIETLVRLYVELRDVSPITIAEYNKGSSAIREDFLVQRAETVIARIHKIVQRLIDAGIYRADINARNMALSIMTMVSGPVALLPVLPGWISERDVQAPAWIDHLAGLVDARCRA